MWNVGETKYPQFVTVWKVEDKQNYASVDVSTSRKDKKTGEYVNSNWKYVRFVGNAYNDDLVNMPKQTRIVIKAGGISSEPYVDKDGNKAWPKYPGIVVFAWEYPPERSGGNDSQNEEPPEVEETDEAPF
jgi:hypothetical protein